MWPRICGPHAPSHQIKKTTRRAATCPANSRPCFPATGDKARYESDFMFGGIQFNRTYHSLDSDGVFPGAIGASFGAGWTTILSQRANTTGWLTDSNGHYEGARYAGSVSIGGSSANAYRSSRDGERLTLVLANEIRVIDAKRQQWVFERTPSGSPGRLVSVVGMNDASVGFTIQRGADGLVTALVDRHGRRLTFFHESPKILIPNIACERASERFDCITELRLPRVSRIELPDGSSLDYTYDRWGNLARVAYPDGRYRNYHYGEPDLASTPTGHFGMHQLTGISDETGVRVMRFGYTPYGSVRLSEVVTANGVTEKTSLRYLSRTEVETTQPEGYQRRYTISDDPYRRITAIAASNGTERWIYNSNNQLTEHQDAQGRRTAYEYSNATPSAVVEAAGTTLQRRVETDLHPIWNQPTGRRIKNAAGQNVRRETFTYDAKGALLSAAVQDPSSLLIQTTTMTRDPEGRVLTLDGPRTDVSDLTTYTYFDAEDPACASAPTTCSFRKGDLKSVTNALGHTTHFVRYDGAGRLLESRDANGLVSSFTYTPRGWLASRTVGGLTTSITYTPVGDVESVTTPDGRSLTYTYDTARRLTAVSDQRGNRIEWTLDNAGNRTAEAVKDASGALRRTLTQQFNTLGRLSQSANAAGQATLYTQDANGNLDLASDPLNRTTDQDVDALDRVTKQLRDVAGLNVQTQFGYDALDQLTTVTDPKGLITRYTNDGLGNLLKLESPDTGTTTYTVDAAGNRTSQTDARGVTVNYAYDALNRLTGISFPTAALNTTFVYDSASGCPAGETFALGRLSSMVDASGSTRWCYDQLGRLTRKTQVTNGRTFTTAYAYDAQGRLSTQTLPSGAIVRFGYASGEVATVAVRLPGSSVDLPLINGIERLPFGPVSKLTYGNGRTQTRAYDLDYAIDRITSSEASGWTQDYSVDPVGNITAILGTGANNRFRYDGLDRLTHADNTSNVTQRAYPVDGTGNRTGKKTSASGAVVPYSYEATSHRLLDAAGRGRSYDAVGNPLTIGARQLTYDDRSRLTVFVNGGTTRRYQYTGQGLRVRKWTSSNTSGNTYFVYNENAQLIGEYDNGGKRRQEIIWLGNLPVGVIAGTTATPVLHYIESDHLGTPRVIVEAARNVGIWRWNQTNDPFGESSPNQNPDGDTTSFTFNLRFAGQYRDSESGWYYNVHRYYDPSIGRYLESDPIGLDGGISTYSYVMSNPLRYVDPLGLKVQVCRRPADLPWPLSETDHYWLRTDRYESGMGPAAGGVPARNSNYDLPGDPVTTNDHSGESKASDAVCQQLDDVDEQCVNDWIRPGRDLGGFRPDNNCQTFASTVINACRKADSPQQEKMQKCLTQCSSLFGNSNLCNWACN